MHASFTEPPEASRSNDSPAERVRQALKRRSDSPFWIFQPFWRSECRPYSRLNLFQLEQCGCIDLGWHWQWRYSTCQYSRKRRSLVSLIAHCPRTLV